MKPPRDRLLPAALVLFAALLFMAAAAWIDAPLWERAFRSDFSAVSWLSSAQLWAAAAVCLRLGFDRTLPRLLSVWLVLALAEMALDEQFMFHERWKYGCTEWTSLCRWTWVRHLPMPCVAVFGLASMAWLHRVLGGGAGRWLLWAAVAEGVWAILVNQLPMPRAVAVLEEGFEVIAESLFLGALLGMAPRNAVRAAP